MFIPFFMPLPFRGRTTVITRETEADRAIRLERELKQAAEEAAKVRETKEIAIGCCDFNPRTFQFFGRAAQRIEEGNWTYLPEVEPKRSINQDAMVLTFERWVTPDANDAALKAAYESLLNQNNQCAESAKGGRE